MAALAFLFGLVFGSFLNVCIYRIPLALPEEAPDESALRAMAGSIGAWKAVGSPARSFCPHCQHLIRWYDNLPVLSWLLLRGRCRDCGARIGFRYAAVELLTAVLFLACLTRFGATWEMLKYCTLSFLLLGLIFTDAEHRLLPDAFTVPGLILGLLFSTLVPINDVVTSYAPMVWGRPFSWTLLSFGDALVGAGAGAGFVFSAGMIYKLVRGQEGMGLGNVKLMAMIGAFLGLKLTVFTIFGASILGTLFGGLMVPRVWFKRLHRRLRCNRESRAAAWRRAWVSAKLVRYYALPFGVFLGAVAVLAVFAGNAVLRWYWNYL